MGLCPGKSNLSQKETQSVKMKKSDNSQLSCVDINGSQEITSNGHISSNESTDEGAPRHDTRTFGISDNPPWSLVILSGIQHLLAMIGGTISVPYLLFSVYCIAPGNPARAELASGLFFVCGIVTILQTALGTRLPIMQGTTFSYLIPIFAVLNSPEWKCEKHIVGVANNHNSTLISHSDEIWHTRISVVSGSLMVSSLLEILLGLTGLLGYLLRFITPLAIAPVLTLVGLALMHEALDYASSNWAISSLTVVLLIFFSENLRNIHLPCATYTKKEGFKRSRGVPIFQLFPVLLAIIIVWILCIILTKCDVFEAGNKARTDLSTELLERAPWFRFPYPTQWGYPTISGVAIIGMLGATMANIIESIGNFYACARLSNTPSPPIHAINRGILIEGIGSFLDGLIGIGNGMSTYAENVGIIGMTQMASRRVMYVAGVLLLLIGLFTKFGAIVMTIPDPIIGGVFIILFSSIATVGLANLQYVDMNSSRNLLAVGVPLLCGLAFPSWLKEHPDAIKTGNEVADSVLKVLLSTSMFLGGVLGILLDNIIPGTPEERGLIKWAELQHQGDGQCKDYDLPFGNACLSKLNCAQYIPILPGYTLRQCCGKGNQDSKLNLTKRGEKDTTVSNDAENIVFKNFSFVQNESNNVSSNL